MSTAREPYQFGREWCWVIKVAGGNDPEYLPPNLFHLLEGGTLDNPAARYYPTRAAALAALADAERRAGNHTGEG